MQHMPCGLLAHGQIAADFVATDTVLAGDKQPDGGQPLGERQRGILNDGPSFQGKLCERMLTVALPYSCLREVRDVLGTALWALHYAIRPAQFHHEVLAVLELSEVEYSF